MMPHLAPLQLARIAAVGIVVLIVSLTIARSRYSAQAVVAPPLEHNGAQALVRELGRCRTITSEEPAALETCRRVWVENRRQFFGSGRVLQSPIDPILGVPATPANSRDEVLPRQVEGQQGEIR